MSVLMQTQKTPPIVNAEENAEKRCENCFYCIVQRGSLQKCIFYISNPTVTENMVCPAWVTLINWSEL